MISRNVLFLWIIILLTSMCGGHKALKSGQIRKLRTHQNVYTPLTLRAVGHPASPPTTDSIRLPRTPPPATKECACGICDHEHNDYGVFDDEGQECCRCVVKFPKCFPAAARVSLENGKFVKMAELQIGDRVQIGSNLGYSEVRIFLEQQPTATTMYTSITTSKNKTIHLSKNHLIYSRKITTERFNPMYADCVSIGDEVLAVQENNKLTPGKVINISSFSMQGKVCFLGAYVPLTMEGSIVVDGVLASCYPSAHHDMAHITLAPIRWFPKIFEWIFGNEIGIQGYVKMAENVGLWILPKNAEYGNI